MTREEEERLEMEALEEGTRQLKLNEELARKRRAEKQVADELIALPESEDLVELAKAAIPSLVRKAIQLAASSDNLPQVLGVLKELTDRAHGKPEQAVKQVITVRKDISDEELARRLLFNAALVNDSRMKQGLPVLEAEIVNE